ncbi:hypothetical protein SARC_04952 [Sphaeroforma arctica JP610]|uniref:PH domain-containing protein n=1 Tax=Sphaeroforma arctica JP610 TaxID=667725 RepID=A0A0L0G1R9_9EUKA|nr:hypothetical protein SARC_04952 [Sphaeroforma arctica JP610]KNC82776.1 hypothetical protein SARC_04952 [Sphaeroforma arctica JP610]|eukprot:XP_014156678.1 hypothetical protein SARC_04952 [Sphaeroforma arctica JP610]
MSRRPSVRPRLRIPLKGRNNGPSLNSPISGPPVAESGRVRLTVTLGTNGHQTVCEANEYDTLTLILESLCLRKGLAMDRYFLAVDNMGVRRTPSASENVHQTLTQYGLSKLLLVEKSVYQVCLSKTSKESHGYNVICQDKDTTQKGVFIWAITANSVVATQDLVVAGDRVLQINNVLCSTMSFEDVLGKLRQNKVELTIASNRNMDDNPFCKPVAFDFEAAAEYRTIFMSISEIEALGCPAVPAKHDQVEVNSIGTVKPILVNVTINEIKREQDNALKAKELFANADWADESVDMKRLGNLVYSGDVYVSVSKREGERWECFLFQREIIMFRKKERASGPTYRLKERLPVTHLVVRDAIQDDGRQVWELVNAQDSKAKNNNPKSYFIECRTAEEKKYWMNKTKGVLKDALKAKKQLPGKPAVAEEVDFLDFLKEAGEAGGE